MLLLALLILTIDNIGYVCLYYLCSDHVTMLTLAKGLVEYTCRQLNYYELVSLAFLSGVRF